MSYEKTFLNSTSSPVDLSLLKRRIESAQIVSFAQMERDLYLMFANATMYNGRDEETHRHAVEMCDDIDDILKEAKAITVICDLLVISLQASPVAEQKSSPIAPPSTESTVTTVSGIFTTKQINFQRRSTRASNQ